MLSVYVYVRNVYIQDYCRLLIHRDRTYDSEKNRDVVLCCNRMILKTVTGSKFSLSNAVDVNHTAGSWRDTFHWC